MKYGSVKLEGNQIYSVGKPLPIHVDDIEYMYVKQNDNSSKIKRASVVAGFISALIFILHPFLILLAFPIAFSVSFYRIKSYELRVFVSNRSGFGSKESCLHSSGFRDEYDHLVAQVKALKEAE